MGLVVFADHVVLGGGKRPLSVEPARLVVEGNRLLTAEPMSRAEFAQSPDEAEHEVVDLGDALLAPAFINGHTHLPMAAYRGIGLASMQGNIIEDVYYRIETNITADDVTAFARVGAYESLLSGVGTVWDHYYFGRAVADAVAEVGLTGVITPTLQDVFGPGVATLEKQVECTLDIDGDGGLAASGVVAGLGPHATDTVSDSLWQRVHRMSVDHDLPFHAHVAQSIEEYQRSMESCGKSPVARLAGLGVLEDVPHALLVHGIYMSQDDLDLLDRDNHTLGFCPYSQLQFAFPASVSSWTQSDLPWLIATDCAASNDTMNVQQELRLVAGLRTTRSSASAEYQRFMQSGGLPAAMAAQQARQADFITGEALANPEFLLSRVWSVPGAMHPKLPVGVLETGAFANFVVLDRRHPALWPCIDPLRALVMCDVAPAISWMMVAGKWIGQRNNFHKSVMDSGYVEAVREATRRLELLGISSGS